METYITTQELQTLQNKNSNIIIIDVRSAAEYETQHIPDAIHIPLDELALKLKEIDPTALIVTACGGGGGRSKNGTRLLTEVGLNAKYLEGGTFGWFGN